MVNLEQIFAAFISIFPTSLVTPKKRLVILNTVLQIMMRTYDVIVRCISLILISTEYLLF